MKILCIKQLISGKLPNASSILPIVYFNMTTHNLVRNYGNNMPIELWRVLTPILSLSSGGIHINVSSWCSMVPSFIKDKVARCDVNFLQRANEFQQKPSARSTGHSISLCTHYKELFWKSCNWE